eukprot:15464746-Alexandrium_andersonii.AAC.2
MASVTELTREDAMAVTTILISSAERLEYPDLATVELRCPAESAMRTHNDMECVREHARGMRGSVLGRLCCLVLLLLRASRLQRNVR